MPERKTKQSFPWVPILFLAGLFTLAHAPFDDGRLQQLDIVLGVSMLAAAFALGFTSSVVIKRSIYLAMDQGPQCGRSLTREFGIPPSKVFLVFRQWQKKHWIAQCAPPDDYEFLRPGQMWYCLTMRGLKDLPSVLGLELPKTSP